MPMGIALTSEIAAIPAVSVSIVDLRYASAKRLYVEWVPPKQRKDKTVNGVLAKNSCLNLEREQYESDVDRIVNYRSGWMRSHVMTAEVVVKICELDRSRSLGVLGGVSVSYH